MSRQTLTRKIMLLVIHFCQRFDKILRCEVISAISAKRFVFIWPNCQLREGREGESTSLHCLFLVYTLKNCVER